MGGKLSKAYSEKIKKMEERIERAINDDDQKRIDIIYCAYEHDEYDNPVDNLDDIPVRGNVKIIDSGDFYLWRYSENENPYKPFESEVINSPTWLRIAIEANRMIQSTNDRHHNHLEDIDSIEIDNNGIKNITLYMW